MRAANSTIGHGRRSVFRACRDTERTAARRPGMPCPATDPASASRQALGRALGFVLAIACSVASADELPLRAAMMSPPELTDARLTWCAEHKANGVVFVVDEHTDPTEVKQAARTAREHALRCYYWIEIARCPSLADEHPRWMASVQGHDEWRRLFKNPPRPDESQVVKVHPWVPVLYEESFAAHLDRVRAVISNLPPAEGILLNDLQGPPSACGCGNPQCRWTADYGPRRTATPKDDFAARDFLVEVRKLTDKQVIPIWVTECEQHDEAADGWCAGVGCFRGICWKAYTKQLMPVAEVAPRIGVLLPLVDFRRNTNVEGQQATWIKAAIDSFQVMPPANGGARIEASRLVPVLQGWDVDSGLVEAQLNEARRAGCENWIVSFARIDQSWTPRIVAVK